MPTRLEMDCAFQGFLSGTVVLDRKGKIIYEVGGNGSIFWNNPCLDAQYIGYVALYSNDRKSGQIPEFSHNPKIGFSPVILKNGFHPHVHVSVLPYIIREIHSTNRTTLNQEPS